ncbi:MAG: LacI family transcriptional regulator [Novosphingobium sp.]|nr:MAG: LacI family transcriptional regulator [Novosphingobium sp.]
MSKPTINDVAAAAGVSKKTVSRVINNSPLLNPETRAKVERVIAELGYVPNPQARALAMGHNFLIALLHDNSNPELVLAAHHGVFEAIRDTEYALILRPVDRSSASVEDDLRHFLETQRPAGVVLLPGVAENNSLANVCAAVGCKYVRISASVRDAKAITSNDREAAAAAVSHLIGLGHQRVGLVAGPDEAGTAQQRELGYLDAMADHDLDRGPALIASGDLSFEAGMAAGNLLLEVSPRPTAIFAVNDAMAAGVLHAAYSYGISVPDQLSIIGFDDTPISARVWPPLTTVHVPIAVMACAAVFKIIYPEQAATLPSHFPLEFVERASVAKPGA